MRPPLAPDWRELSLRRSNVCVPQRSQLFNRASKNRSVSGKPCLRDHLSITTIFLCTAGWSLKTGFTVFEKPFNCCLIYWKYTLLVQKFLKEVKWGAERLLLPRAIFLIFTRNRPWKSEDHLCKLFFIEMSKESLEKRTPQVPWRSRALSYTAAIDRTTFHACQQCRKTAVLAVFFSRFWDVIWRGKAFRDQQCQFLTRNKNLSSENESRPGWVKQCFGGFSPISRLLERN